MQEIQLEFLSLDTESCCDIVHIYDGEDRSSLLGTFSGGNIPNVIYSDNSLLVVFTTDSSVTSSGFQIKYNVLENILGK